MTLDLAAIRNQFPALRRQAELASRLSSSIIPAGPRLLNPLWLASLPTGGA